jgi:predicted GNAT family acetyltransferase
VLARPVRRNFVVQQVGKNPGQYSEELDDMDNAVSNNPAYHRYELKVDGHIAATYHKIADGVITFTHTEVPPELGGKGIGSRLIKGALDQVRADVVEGDRAVRVRKGLH